MQSLLIDDASVLIDSKSPIIVCVEAYLDTNYDTLIFDDKSFFMKNFIRQNLHFCAGGQRGVAEYCF